MLLAATYVDISINSINSSLLWGLQTAFTLVFQPQAHAAERKV